MDPSPALSPSLPREYDLAIRLLKSLYRSIEADYRVKYRQDIWRQVESKIRLAARTSPSLALCMERFLGFPHNEIRDPALVVEVLAAGLDRPILRIYREEAGPAVALLRAQLDADRAAREEVA